MTEYFCFPSHFLDPNEGSHDVLSRAAFSRFFERVCLFHLVPFRIRGRAFLRRLQRTHDSWSPYICEPVDMVTHGGDHKTNIIASAHAPFVLGSVRNSPAAVCTAGHAMIPGFCTAQLVFPISLGIACRSVCFTTLVDLFCSVLLLALLVKGMETC